MATAQTTRSTTLPDRLRRARIRAGLSQREAAELVGTSRGYVNRIEQGIRHSPATEARLAHALGVRVSVADLFPEAPK